MKPEMCSLCGKEKETVKYRHLDALDQRLWVCEECYNTYKDKVVDPGGWLSKYYSA